MRRGVVAVVAVVALAAGCGGDGHRSTIATTSTTSSTTTTTSSTTTTTAPSAPLPPGASVVTADAAVLAPAPRGGETRRLADDCAELATPSWEADCGRAATAGAPLVWLVEEDGRRGGRRVVIWRVERGRAVPVLQAVDPDGTELLAVHVEVVDLDGRPGEEVVVGFRLQGSGAFLELDVVGGDGTVVAHRSLDHGRAAVRAGVLEDWAAEFGPDDPNCCPATFARSAVTFDGGPWRAAPVASEPADLVPAGQFP